ncbi:MULTISPECIES: T9SS type A sorting domain-containing protein [unclassified Lentimicrobium]|uniref:T9SS type A sorting domain-containing protein n=1 Tax=unclassified Lentimicrobium TaxID=2677434 RepID=UPI001557C707|nr:MULTISPECIES: T9SS type A sorting domain-containing protein [unclassified Lentimicrobium]NPD48235.1 T9SS type A sorting domain-containing protein [Lentimicrobium sp. S6]NPD85252.1 T9SS type A sorting domain-containing protein [Lentimicrobium sp. L6]
MKKILYILLLSTLTINTIAQNWTEPIQISTLQGVNNNSDFCIDNLGIIHCVWSYKVESNYKHIYYSKSTDDGQTWSTPENVSQNTSLWMENPHIVADSENNLHLTYDYDVINPGGTLIVYRKYEDNMWSSYDTVSIAWTGARHNRLVIDHNDKLYCFWFHDFQNGTTFYRVLENGVWGEIQIPYNNNDSYYLERAVVDNTNKIHCSGYRYFEGQSAYDQRIVYCTYWNNAWSDLLQVSYDYDAWAGNDITLDNDNNPQIVWRQMINDNIPPDNGTLFTKFDGTNWSNPIILAEDASEQAIIVDLNNKTHIIDNEEFEDGYRLVHYQLLNNEWVGEIIDEGDFGNYGNKLISKANYLYLVSAKAYSSSPNPDIPIVIRKHEITTSVENSPIVIDLYNIYPNPTKAHTTISYSIKETELISIKIYDIQGKLINTLLEKKQTPNKYQIIWKGTDKNNKEVKSGLYLIRLQTGRQFITRLVEIIK